MQVIGETESIVVKNTFLEIADSNASASLFTRQLSEPAKKVSCFSRQISLQSQTSEAMCRQVTLSEYGDFDEHTTTGGRETPKSTAPSSDSASDAYSLSGRSYAGLSMTSMGQMLPPLSHQMTPPPSPYLFEGAGHFAAHTVTVRNVPANYTKQKFAQELQDAGFGHGRDYNLLYMPGMGRCSVDGTMTCFINFVSTTSMNAFASAFDGRMTRHDPSSQHKMAVSMTTAQDLRQLGAAAAATALHDAAGTVASGNPNSGLVLGTVPPRQLPPQQVVPPASAASYPDAPLRERRPLQMAAILPMPSQAPAQFDPRQAMWSAPTQPQETRPQASFCPSCGSRVNGNFNFCSQCGFSMVNFRQGAK
jgi:hypothetical protein